MLTNIDYIRTGAVWPPESEGKRLEKYSANRKLFDGRHMDVYREAVDRRLFREETNEVIYIVLNYPKRLSTHWADLLFTEEPVVASEGKKEQAALERLVWDSDVLSQVGPEVAIDMSRYGDGLFKVYLEDGRGKIESLSPTYWFPVGTETNARRIQAHVLAWEFERDNPSNKSQPLRFVRFEIHERGSITHKVFELRKNPTGEFKLGDELKAVEFDDSLAKRVNGAGVELTKVDDFLIVPAPNLRTSDDYHGRDDYTDLESVVSELEVRLSQVVRILDKHADPNMYGDDTALVKDEETGRWTFKGGGKFFPVNGRDGVVPGYVTWDGQLQAAYDAIDRLLDAFFFLAETSPSAFGLPDKGGAVTSGFQFRLSLIAALNKVSRLSKSIGPAIRYALTLASQLEAANGDGVIVEPEITWRDGVPSDPKEEAETESILVGSGLRSRLTAIKKLNDFTTDEQAQEELQRIREEEAETAGSGTGQPPQSILGRLRQNLNADDGVEA